MSRGDALEQGAALGRKARARAGRRACRGAVQSRRQHAELRRARGWRQCALQRAAYGRLYAPYWWDVRLFKPRETAEARITLSSRRHALRLRSAGARDAAWSCARQRCGAHARRNACARRLGRRFRAVQAARAIAADAAQRSRRPRLRLRAPQENAWRRAFPLDARRRRRPAQRGSCTTCTFRRPSTAATRNCARRTTTIAQVASLVAGAAVRNRRLRARRAVAHCASERCSGSRAFVAGAIVAGLNAPAMLANAPQAWFGFDTAQSEWVFWGQQIGVALLVTGRRDPGACARVHGGGGPLPHARFPIIRSSGACGRDRPRRRPSVLGRTLGGYLFVADRARADRRHSIT